MSLPIWFAAICSAVSAWSGKAPDGVAEPGAPGAGEDWGADSDSVMTLDASTGAPARSGAFAGWPATWSRPAPARPRPAPARSRFAPARSRPSDFCRTYDIVEYPTIIALSADSQMQNMWSGLPLPTISEVSFYV